jgi:hypothetical protein
MPTFFWIALGIVLAFGLLLVVIFTVAVKAGKLKVKKGGAPGTSSSSGGVDPGSML